MISRVKKNSSIYTKTFSNERLIKSDLMFDCLGDFDELISFIGLIKVHFNEIKPQHKSNIIQTEIDFYKRIQEKIMQISSIIATNVESNNYNKLKKIDTEDVDKIKSMHIHTLEKVKLNNNFILPGDHLISTYVDVSRTITRKSERNIIKLIQNYNKTHLRGFIDDDISKHNRITIDEKTSKFTKLKENIYLNYYKQLFLIQHFLNKLADLFFIKARYYEQHIL